VSQSRWVSGRRESSREAESTQMSEVGERVRDRTGEEVVERGRGFPSKGGSKKWKTANRRSLLGQD
jgi:hypothetical protein